MKKLLSMLVALMLVFSCTGMALAEEKVVIRYSMWDAAQEPAYQQIAADFMAANPGIEVQIELIPWSDYWTKLTTQASSGSCPDLMTMFINNFLTLQNKGVFEGITGVVEEAGIDLSKFNKTALDAFTVDGELYGLPKDFDSLGVFYNINALKEAGYEAYPADLEWNIEDGGSYVKFLQDLTVDVNGLHPYEEGFDPFNIEKYGLLPIDRNDFTLDSITTMVIEQNGGVLFAEDGTLQLSNPNSMGALEFLWKLSNEWYVMPSLSVIATTGPEALFYSGTCATWINGPWSVAPVDANASFEWAVARFPKGPNGESTSRVNSLVDCVYSKSEHKEEAAKFMLYIATEGQHILGETGTVIPAYGDLSSTYVDFYAAQGFDVSPFIEAYNGSVVFPSRVNEFARAADIASREFTLAFNNTGDVDLETAVANIEAETNEFLLEANAK